MGLTNPKIRDKIIKDHPNIKSKDVPNTLGLWVRPGEVPPGLKAYDTIIGVNDVMINDGLGFSNALKKYNVGDKVTLTIIRKRVFRKVEVTLKVFPVDAAKLFPKKTNPMRWNGPTIPSAFHPSSTHRSIASDLLAPDSREY